MDTTFLLQYGMLRPEIMIEVSDRLQTCLERQAQLAFALGSPRVGRRYATSFSKCLTFAVGEYADLLTSYLVSRNARMQRENELKIIEEALSFTSDYTKWRMAGQFLAMAMGMTRVDRHKIPKEERDAFLTELEVGLASWQSWAGHKIRLRCLVSSRPAQPLRSQDLHKSLIARVKGDDPTISQRDLCARLDAMNDKRKDAVPAPVSWQRIGERSWVGALQNPVLKARVKKYLSAIKPAPQRRRAHN